MNRTAFCLCALLSWQTGHAESCWQQAAARFDVPPELLVAIAAVESGFDPRAKNMSHTARTGSTDLGLMQINSAHLPRLAQWGISPTQLLDPCINVHVGAWLLAEIFSRLGRTWEAVGAYNAGCSQLKGSRCAAARASYAWKVYRQLPEQFAAVSNAAAGNTP
jgi:soluble lytic murein transglycosylase-like protein